MSLDGIIIENIDVLVYGKFKEKFIENVLLNNAYLN